MMITAYRERWGTDPLGDYPAPRDFMVESIFGFSGVSDGWIFPGEEKGFVVYCLAQPYDHECYLINDCYKEHIRSIIDDAKTGTPIDSAAGTLEGGTLPIANNACRMTRCTCRHVYVRHYWGKTSRPLYLRMAEHMGVFDNKNRDQSDTSFSDRVKNGWIPHQIERLMRTPYWFLGLTDVDKDHFRFADRDCRYVIPQLWLVESGLSSRAADVLERECIEWSFKNLPSLVTNEPTARMRRLV